MGKRSTPIAAWTGFLRGTAVGTVALLVVGCSLLTGLEDEPFDEPLVGGSVGGPAWARDGRTIYFSNRLGPRVTTFDLNAVDVLSGEVRTLAHVIGWNTGGEQARTAADPSTVFYAIANPPYGSQYSVYAVPSVGGDIDTVATNAGVPWFVVSDDGRRFAFKAPDITADTIKVVSVSGPERRQTSIRTVPEHPRVVALSPDGSTLIYRGDGKFYSVPVEGGPQEVIYASSAGPSPESGEAVAPQVRWDGDTPHLVVASLGTVGGEPAVLVHDVNGVTGDKNLLGTIEGVDRLPWTMAGGRDGDSFAAWVPVELIRDTVERDTYRFQLVVKRTGESAVKVVDEWSSDERLTWLAFSPDGRRLGFVAKFGKLHVVDLGQSF